jgi:RimJ/RimL family protein N-acetyltransferase
MEIEIVCSGEPGVEQLRDANPGNWMAVEWDELLRGQLGPWAMAHAGGRVVSICHTPGPLRERAGECGVWTAPGYRGRGYAAATVVAWLPLVRSDQRQLFYSTDADNRSSQAVARRLGLREIGWTWRLHPRRPPRGEAVHPLCSLFATAVR